MPHFTTSDGLRLYFEDSGQGQPLLCLAGLTRNTRDFAFLAPHLAEFRMISMDYRGRGQSDFAPDFNSYNVLQEAQDVLELLDHLGFAKVSILGTSRGGLIAMALAAGHIERLSAVILNDVGPVISAEGIARILDYVGKEPVSRTYEAAAAAMKAVLAPQFPGVTDHVWLAQAKAQYRQTDNGLALRYDPRLREALETQAATGQPPDLWPLFDALKPLPVGVLRGANSDILEAETLKQMQDRHPGLIAVTVPDRGHVPFLDEPESLELVNRVLKEAK